MAKYNLSRHNLAKYNRSAEGTIIYDKITVSALFQAFIGLGQKTKDALKIETAFTGQAKMASGTLEISQLETIFTAAVAEKYIAYGHDSISAVFDGEAYLSPLVNDKTTWAAVFMPSVYLAGKVRDALTNEAVINCKTYLGNKVKDKAGIMAYAIFGTSISAEALEEFIMDLNITIPKNGVLVIDSDNFRVLLNGNNAIKYHSGDWIDQLNRTSKSITIQGGGNSLEATIYYQELWL